MIKVICVSLTYYGSVTINGHSTNCSVDYSIPGFLLELGKIYTAVTPEHNSDRNFLLLETKISYPKSLFRVLADLREEQINSILND